MSQRTLEDRFLGALLGLAIGDALGMPVAEQPVADTLREHGEISTYMPRHEGAEDEIPAGEITDETETVLCIVESMTANHGRIDPEIVNARLMHLAEGPSHRWMPESMRAGIREAFDTDGLVPESGVTDGSLAVAVRGVPIGLMHGLGGFDEQGFVEDTRLVTRLSHGGVGQHQLVVDVAIAVTEIVRGETIGPILISGDLDGVSTERREIAEIVDSVRTSETFEAPVLEAVNRLRPADSAGAIAGGIAGALRGATSIPQALIDGLEARVYLSLAAPWYYRTAARRAGILIDLRQV